MLSATKEILKMLTEVLKEMCLDMPANTSYFLNPLKNKCHFKVYQAQIWLCSMG